MAEEIKYICTNEDCDLDTSGKCAKGHNDVSECPYSSKQISESSQSDDDAKSTAPTIIELSSGHDLSVNETFAITAKSLTRLIVLAGSSGSGKTTLLASLYEMFQQNPFAGYLFAGSETLLGFEKRCHLARIASNRVKPYTERTTIGYDNKLLHLRVRKEDQISVAQDLLFSDISGETYRLARDSDDECKRLTIIKRADHFGLVIDGEKISSLETRQSAFQDAKNLLRRCVENEMIGSSSFINIIFSKYDTYKDKEEANSIFIPHIKEYFKKKYKKNVMKLEFHEVAARPQIGSNVPNGYGLDQLFQKWVDDSPLYIKTKETCLPNLEESREFEKFLLKHFKERLT